VDTERVSGGQVSSGMLSELNLTYTDPSHRGDAGGTDV
jgi:hypothetical protein